MQVVGQLAVLAVAAAYPAATWPAGFDAAACPNYPYCDAVTGINYAPGIAAERIAHRAAGYPYVVGPAKYPGVRGVLPL